MTPEESLTEALGRYTPGAGTHFAGPRSAENRAAMQAVAEAIGDIFAAHGLYATFDVSHRSAHIVAMGHHLNVTAVHYRGSAEAVWTVRHYALRQSKQVVLSLSSPDDMHVSEVARWVVQRVRAVILSLGVDTPGSRPVG